MKLFWYPFLSAIFTTVVLYSIGSLFEIKLLSWNFYIENESEDFMIGAGGSLIPVIIGVIVGFAIERMIKWNGKNSSV